MPTIDDIDTAKQRALAILDQKIRDAGPLLDSGAAGMDAVIDTLEDQHQSVLDEAVDAALGSAELAAALAAIRQATGDMQTVARRMVTAPDYIKEVANLGTAVNSVVAALTKPTA